MSVHPSIQRWAKNIRYGSRWRREHTEDLTYCKRCGAFSLNELSLLANYKASDSGDLSSAGYVKALRQIEKQLGYPRTERINGHHYDYAKPCEVEGLCDKCHSLAHDELRSKTGQLDMFKPY